MKFSVVNLNRIFLAYCELLGIAALYFAPEINKTVILTVPLCGLALTSVVKNCGERLIFILMATVVLGGIYLGFFSDNSIVALTSTCTIIIHTLIWFSSEQRRYRYWRVGLGLLEVILAAILSTQTYMFFIIFFFMMGCSLALSFSFLERNFELRDPEAVNKPIRKSFVAAVFSFSVLIFLLGLVIFPILPRSNWAMNLSSQTETGYSEIVSFRDPTLAWSRGEPRTVMWLFLGNNSVAFPLGLIRGKSLDVFDGVEWTSGTRQLKFSTDSMSAIGARIDIVRDPLPTDVLPIPYGGVKLESKYREIPHQTLGGEWVLNSKRGKKVEYSVMLTGRTIFDGDDRPRKVHTKIPDSVLAPRLDALAKKLAGNDSDLARVKRVENYFIKEKFTAELAEVQAAEPGKTHPTENFLFDKKAGHCELFATATALLFRKMGMPARVIVGFRIPMEKNGNLISIRNTDAHAWVEVWTNERGWMALDTTPATAPNGALFSGLSNAFDYVNAYWNKYILSYEFDFSGFRKYWWMAEPFLPIFFLLLLGGLFIKGALAFFAWQKNYQRPRVMLGRAFERISKAKMPASEYNSLKEKYYELRFGPIEPSRSDVAEFELECKKAIFVLKSLSAS